MDVRVALESEILKHKQFWDKAKLVDVVLDGEWLFDAAYSYELYNAFQKDNKTLSYMYDHLIASEAYCQWWSLQNDQWSEYMTRENNKKVPVQVSFKDVVNVFAETAEWKRSLALLEAQWLYRRSVERTSNDAFQRSCKWVLWCKNPLIQQDMSKRPEWNHEPVTTSQLSECVSMVSNLYSRYGNQAEIHLTYDEDRDREIYWNGIVEEDRWHFCDINALLEDINKTISCDAEDSPRYSSYDPQTVPKKVDDDITMPETYQNSPSNLPDAEANPLEKINEHIPTEGVPEKEREEEADYLVSRENGKPRIWPNTTVQDIWNTARLAEKPKEWDLSSLTAPKKVWNDRVDTWLLLQNHQCTITRLWPDDAPIDMYKEWTELAEVVNEYVWQLDLDERDKLALWHPDTRTVEEQESYRYDDAPLSKAELDAMIDDFDAKRKTDSPDVQQIIKEMEEELKACIKEHTDEEVEWVWKFVKKAYGTAPKVSECLAKVLCTEIWDPSWIWIYRVKLCSVPAKEYRTANVIPSLCISDSLDALASVTAKIDDGWRTINHVYSKEFLEFQAFWLDYASRFVFTVNTNFRSPRTTKNPKNNKMEVVQKIEDIQSLILQEQKDKHILKPYKTEVKLENAYITDAQQVDAQFWTDYHSAYLKTQDMIRAQDVKVDQIKDQLRKEMNIEQTTHLMKTLKDHDDHWEGILKTVEEIKENIKKQNEFMLSTSKR